LGADDSPNPTIDMHIRGGASSAGAAAQPWKLGMRVESVRLLEGTSTRLIEWPKAIPRVSGCSAS